jgi:CRISPR-associated protein Cas1
MSQFKSATSKEFTSNLCKIIIAGKIQNYRNILQRYLRDYGANLEVENASERLYRIRNSVLSIEDIDVLRGLEGEAAASYFSVFNFLILNRDNTFLFNGRNKRPPKDPVNAMLSFVYTLLASEVQSALETVGLDPYVGFLHTLRPGRASLALDLMEELRAYMGDRLILSIINRKQISAKDFVFQDSDNILMTDKTKKEILNSWQKRKQDIITHPYLNEQIPIGLLPYTQALLLARYLRGDLDNYPVFISK